MNNLIRAVRSRGNEPLPPLPPLRYSGRGYHVDVATFVAERFGRSVSQESIAEYLKPLSDGSVIAAAHAVSSRSGGLSVRYLEKNADDGGVEAMRRIPGIPELFVKEAAERKLILLGQGKDLGLQIFDRIMTLAEIESLLETHRLGLVSLDWQIITSDKSFRANLREGRDEHLLFSRDNQQQWLYPIVPAVGVSRSGILVHTYAFPSLVIPRFLFEKARLSERAEQAVIFVTTRHRDFPEEGATSSQESIKPNKKMILKQFRISERREQRGNWPEIVELYCDNQEPCEAFIDKAAAYGLSHQMVTDAFDFIWHDTQALYPAAFHRFLKTIDLAQLADISPAEVTELFYKAVAVVRKEREDSLTTDSPLKHFEMLSQFEKHFHGTLQRAVEYKGPGKIRLVDALTYSLMDLKLIEGPKDEQNRPAQRARKQLLPPFEQVCLDQRDSEFFKVIRPPREGEPECVTHVRILAEWLEQHGGDLLRNCLIQALGKGTLRLSSGEEVEILTTPLHRLAAAIKEKMSPPYFIKELCLNHGLSAWQMIAEYDAYVDAKAELPKLYEADNHPEFQRSDIWGFSAMGLLQNLREVNQVPASFAAEISYLQDLMPWMVAGRVHPAYCSLLSNMFASCEHRYSNDDGYRLLDRIEQAKKYLDKLLEGEIRSSNEGLWAAIRNMPDKQLVAKVEPAILACLASDNLSDFKDKWRDVLKMLKPHLTSSENELEELNKYFLEASLERKRELARKEEE